MHDCVPGTLVRLNIEEQRHVFSNTDEHMPGILVLSITTAPEETGFSFFCWCANGASQFPFSIMSRASVSAVPRLPVLSRVSRAKQGMSQNARAPDVSCHDAECLLQHGRQDVRSTFCINPTSTFREALLLGE